jgi:sucrose-6-phosphate hydrolase SacC (GH32 family)
MKLRIRRFAIGICIIAAFAGAAATARSADDGLYQEKYRPQFHFTARQWNEHKLNPGQRQEGWLNDPNGLVFFRGEYHLFAQRWNKCWIHAVSKDLVYWTELEPAFWEDDRYGTGVQSGGAVVDKDNTSRLATDPKTPPLVAFWAGNDNRSQCISYSLDAGRTWKKYEKNPILVHPERDPKVFWHEPDKRWIMVLYGNGSYHFFISTNLLDWQDQKYAIGDSYECPDMFQLPVDGDPQRLKWVLVRGNGKYSIGEFDGSKFAPETDQLPCDLGANFYATQSWGDIDGQPDRRVQIAWMRGGRYPDMPFNQQLTFPCDLTLHSFPEGPRICRLPVDEIKSLYARTQAWKDRTIKPGENPFRDVSSELFEIHLQAEPGAAKSFGIRWRGATVAYSPEKRSLSCLGKEVKVPPADGQITLRVLIDRTSIEVFASDGRISMSSCYLPKPQSAGLELFTDGGDLKLLSLTVHELKSAWQSGNDDKGP